MKSFRLDVSKGINALVEKTSVEAGYLSACDGIDLRNLTPKPFASHTVLQIIASGFNCIYAFRGKFYTSDTWRDYSVGRSAGKDVLYWTDYSNLAHKSVEDVTAQLGCPVPTASPIVEIGNKSLVSFTLSLVNVSSQFNKGKQRFYRIAAEYPQGIWKPTDSKSIAIDADLTKSVKITWSQVADAIAYNIFAGDFEGSEKLIARIGLASTEFIDNGAYSYGKKATVYDPSTELTTYLYTFERDVNGQIDESGPSPLSNSVTRSNTTLVKMTTPDDMLLAGTDYAVEPYDICPKSQSATSTSGDGTSSSTKVDAVVKHVGTTTLTLRNDDFTLATSSAYALVVRSGGMVTIVDNDGTYGTCNAGGGTATISTVLPFDNADILGIVKRGSGFGTIVDVVYDIPSQSTFVHASYISVEKDDLVFFFTDPSQFEQPGNIYKVADYDGANVIFDRIIPEAKIGSYMRVMKAVVRYSKEKTGNVVTNAIPEDGNVLISNTTPYINSISSVKHKDPESTDWNELYVNQMFSFDNAITYSVKLVYDESIQYIKTKNLYRSVGTTFLLVEKLPLHVNSYLDVKSDAALGEAVTSYYEVDGVPVIYAPPPLGMTGMIEHKGMNFAIDGDWVRWTPIDVKDAWPEFFKRRFAFRPVALASFAGALIILGQDQIYRMDGNSPEALALNTTLMKEGCIAPHSVQTLAEGGLIYLSNRGVMISTDGMSARCVTDQKIDPKFWSEPSILPADTAEYCLLPTRLSHSYASLCFEDGLQGSSLEAIAQHGNLRASHILEDVKSFVWDNRYFLYWTNTSGNYGAGTAVCIDLRREGFPVTTLPYRIKAACRNEFGEVFAILKESAHPIVQIESGEGGDIEVVVGTACDDKAFIPFQTQECNFGRTPVPVPLDNLGEPAPFVHTISKMFSSQTCLPVHFRTGQQALGSPVERKEFRHVEFHGTGVQPGTFRVKIYIDRRYVCDGKVTLSESPNAHRKINIPLSRCVGYVIDVECCGTGHMRAMEFAYEPMAGTS